MKLHIERTVTTPKLGFNHETNKFKKNINICWNRNGFSFLTMTIVCTVGLCGFSIAQSAGSSSEENNGINAPCYDVMMPDAENKNKGGVPSVLTASFVEVGAPAGGYPSITDIVTFNGKMYLATSSNPLGAFGTNVFYTTDGVNYTNVLDDPSSQGYLRIGVIDSKLWIPDGDPNGLDPSFVYISSTGLPGSFTQTQIIGAVHSFEVVKYNNQMYVSNGMNSGVGGLCKYDGSNTWNQVYSSSNSVRMKYMATINGKLIVANRNSAGDIDGFVWSGDPQTNSPVLINPLPGATNTFRMFVSSTGKLFWSISAGSTKGVLMTTDGVNWQAASTLDGIIVSDFAELNGKLYALATNGLWESSDYFTFTNIAAPPATDPNAFIPAVAGPGVNPDAPASMEPYNGYLWCGSSRNGKVYQVDVATSTPELPSSPVNYEVTDHSVIFHLKNNAPVALCVYSLHGSLVKNISCGMVSAGRYEIYLGEMKQGFYLLQAVIDNEVKGIKFVRR